MGTRIKDAALVGSVSEGYKIPVSDGSNQPKTASVGQIGEFVNQKYGVEQKLSELGSKVLPLDSKVINLWKSTESKIGRVVDGSIMTSYTDWVYQEYKLNEGDVISFKLMADVNTYILSVKEYGKYTPIYKGSGMEVWSTGTCRINKDGIYAVCSYKSKNENVSAIQIQSVINELIYSIEGNNKRISKFENLGELTPISGGNVQSLVDIANRMIKSIKMNNIPEGYVKGTLRLRQIYHQTPSTHRWQFQIAMLSEDYATISLIDTINFFAENKLMEASGTYFSIVVDGEYLCSINDTEATTYLMESSLNNRYEINLSNDYEYLNGAVIKKDSLPIPSIQDAGLLVKYTDNVYFVKDITGYYKDKVDCLNKLIKYVNLVNYPLGYKKGNLRIRQMGTLSSNRIQIQIGQVIQDVDTIELIDTIVAYKNNGRIKIKGQYVELELDTDSLEGVPDNTQLVFESRSNNPYMILLATDINYISGELIRGHSIDKDKLAFHVDESGFSNCELFSLGDSLSAGGIWQTKVAELTGCVFDQTKNNKAGAMLSVGGTNSFGPTFDNVLWRAKNLIDQGYIQGQGENAIVVLENVNDSYNAFDDSARTIVPTTPIEGYSESEFTSDLLNSLRDKYNINAVFRLTKTLAGKNLKITSLPTKEGDVTLRVGWAGPGYSNYNVHVVPQASDDLTMKYVLDKILEYAYTGITDALGEDGISVDFSSGNANYMPTVEFTDTDNTGMTCVVTDNPNAKTSIAKYFIGDSIDDWTNLSKWQTGITYSQGWKSTIELLMRTYPKLNLFVSLFPMHSVTASEYLLPNGTYDTAAYNKVSRMENMRKMQVELGNIAKFYSLPFLDVFAECGIGISNMLTYYNASANVHPKDEGYYKFGETIASQLKRYIV